MARALAATSFAEPELLALGPSAVLWAVMDAVVDGYGPALDGLEEDVDEVEDQVFAEGRSSATKRIYTLKREAMEFFRAVHPLVLVLERLSKGDVPLQAASTVELFRDVHDHVLRAGVEVPLRLEEGLDSNNKTLREGQQFRMTVASPVMLGNAVVIPAGSPATGETWLRTARRWAASGSVGGVTVTSSFSSGRPSSLNPDGCPPGRLRPYTVTGDAFPNSTAGG